ncbi:LacI family DNA-binding transcriptional regulator [Saccharopolyspora griseoalba]|uniref:LacI family DNA-binding transcriptional regulator n=1 Tax=Saccharopolyspora griseoalba TaxID=1431848 RepID=A0ABW2LEG6_9PSEU
MADVARTAGVSIATVSHVLNGTRAVHPDTGQAVLDAIEQCGYVHNTLARALVTTRTRTIGVVISSASTSFSTEILRGAEGMAVQHGYTLLVADPRDDPDHEFRVVSNLVQRQVDGIVLAPSGEPSRTIRYLDDHKIPAVLADRVLGGEHDQVSAENAEPTALLVDHVAELGHRRIGFIAGIEGMSTTAERCSGYREGLRRNGIDSMDELCRSGGSEFDAARRAATELLTRSQPPTALVAANNAMTIGAMQAVRDLELRVPEDVALVGFDDFPWADLFSPRLTVISQPSEEIGSKAVELLLDRLDDLDRPPREHRLPSRFVHRESCGCSR